MKKVAVVILNWNGKNWLEQFLPNVIEHSNNIIADIIVADNASTDDSVAFVKKEFPNVQLIEMSVNDGYAGGYNESLAQLDHKYFVLLNSDVEVSPNWLEPLVELMDEHPNIGACQPKLRAFNDKESFEYAGACGGFIDYLGYPFCRGRLFDTVEKDEGQYESKRKIFWATGAALFIRNDVFRQLGGLDQDFFAHMEEIDLCWRTQNAGYEIWVEPKSIVYHVGGGTLPQGNPRKTYLNFRNNLFLLFKNLPLGQMIFTILARLVLDGVATIHMFFKGNFADIFAVLKAHLSFYFAIPKLIKKRKKIDQGAHPLQGMFSKSILWFYFIRRKKAFSEFDK